MLTNQQIRHLRKFADDETKNVARRLHAIDVLASAGGLYCLRKTEQFYHAGKNIRARRAVVHLLLKLLKAPSPETKRTNTVGITERLRFVQTGLALDGWTIYLPKPAKTDQQAGQHQSPVATDLESFLAEHGYTEEKNEHR
jgi:hypothetical protein